MRRHPHAGRPAPDSTEAYTFCGFTVRRDFASKPKTRKSDTSHADPSGWEDIA